MIFLTFYIGALTAAVGVCVNDPDTITVGAILVVTSVIAKVLVHELKLYRRNRDAGLAINSLQRLRVGHVEEDTTGDELQRFIHFINGRDR